MTLAVRLALACAFDPVLLARRAGLTLDHWQAALVRGRARQVLLLCARQSGKSTVAALMAVDEALHRSPALVLILAPALRQAQELFRKVKDIFSALGPDTAALAQESALSIELANGSRIVCLPGKEATVRGYSNAALLLVDEAARVSDDLYMALRPMLAVSGGRVVLLSTPFGKRGFFFRECTEGGPGWQRVKVTAHECPRIDPTWLAEERSRIGDWWFAQEYVCEFVETDDQVFSYEVVMAALDDDLRPLFAVSEDA